MRRPGDRRDAKLLRDIDSMHFIMPLMYPNRCDNEAFISETIDLTNVMKYLEKKNAEGPDYKYNFFQVMVTAVLKTITLRPQLNRFIANYNLYERNEVSAAFTIKKIFKDDGDEALAFIHSKPTDNLESIHNEIYRQVSYVRHEGKDRGEEDQERTAYKAHFSVLPALSCSYTPSAKRRSPRLLMCPVPGLVLAKPKGSCPSSSAAAMFRSVKSRKTRSFSAHSF